MQATQSSSQDTSDIRRMVRSALRFRWVVVTGVALLVAVLWAAWFEASARERDQTLAAAGRRQTNLAIAVGHFLARGVSNADALGRFLTSAYATDPGRIGTVLAERARANELFRELLVCEAGGKVTSSSSMKGPHRADWCVQWQALAPADARAYPMVPVYLGDEVLIPLVTRMPGRPGVLLAVLVEVHRLLGVLADYRILEETVVLVAGVDGYARARWHSVDGMSEQRAPEVGLLEQVLAGGGAGQRHLVEGRAMVVTAHRMRGYPVYVMVATLERDVFAPSRTRALYTAVACAMATVVLVLLSWILVRLQRRTLELAGAIEKANTSLARQVRARTASLEEAYSELETFSYAVAHDVRAPIAAIGGFAQALRSVLPAGADAKALHYLDRISANAARMSELTEALLSLGRLSRAPVLKSVVDLSAVAREAMATLRELEPADRKIDLHVQDGLRAVGDPVLLRQVMENLLGNSCKFTRRRSVARIRVTGAVEAGSGLLAVCIEDNGEGFEMTADRKEFVPFQRRHPVAEFPGTGVGLAAVDRIVRLHDGTVQIASKPEEGTVVSFTVPASR